MIAIVLETRSFQKKAEVKQLGPQLALGWVTGIHTYCKIPGAEKRGLYTCLYGNNKKVRKYDKQDQNM